jgi:hypothetical protein
MFIKKGKTNWMMIIIVALIAGAVGGGLVGYVNDTIKQTHDMSQSIQAVNPQRVQPVPGTINSPVIVEPKDAAPQQ